MKIFDLLRLCLDNLRRRKGRTALTVVGVMVGTCSIVVMVSLGVGINQTQMEMMASWGDLTQIQIMNHNNNANSEMPALDDAKIAEIQNIPKVLAATPVYQSQVLNSQIFAGKKEKYSTYGWNIYGMNAAAIEVMGYKLNEGEYFEAGLNNKKIPILVGQYTAYSFEDTTKSYRSSKRRVDRYLTDDSGNPKPPFFDMMKEKNYVLRTEKVDEKGKQYEQPLTVTGVLVEDYGKGWYTSEGIIMDINQLKRLEKEYKKINNIKDTKEQGKVKGYEQVYVKVETVDDVEAVETLIKDMGYQTYSMSSQRQEMQKQSNTMQMILGGIGAISLIVAAIGIANTMTMAIYERTKEIGIMKVLGCRLSEIRSMFLIESATIGLMGGVVGIILSFALSIALNQFAPMIGASMGMGMGGDVASKISVIPFWLVMLGLGFSAGVGLLSGLLPANKAVKISALEAIRHE